eukprot:3112278-Lingulodinium_polyedra.AAC.1
MAQYDPSPLAAAEEYPRYCTACCIWLATLGSWHEQLLGRKHRKHARGLDARDAMPPNWIRKL